MNEVDKKFENFITAIRDTDLKKEIRTIPEVYGIQYKEVYITKWITYLLKTKAFGIDILNLLLSINRSDVKIGTIKKVHAEYVFDTKRRIDILIFTDKYLIGIENKIWSGEQENQTSDYKACMETIKAKTKGIEDCIGIFLHPEQNSTNSDHFDNVTYTQLYNQLKKIKSCECSDSFEKMMFEQFMMYVKEYLYMNNGEFPEISDNVKLYAQYINIISAISDDYKSTSSRIIEWLKYKFENSQYEILEAGNGYMQIVPRGCKEKWEAIGFHLEILWSRDFMINGEIEIEAHLEKTKGDNVQQIFHKFDVANVEYRGHDKPLVKGNSVSCNFETETKAEDTFKQILNELERLRKEHEEWETIL